MKRNFDELRFILLSGKLGSYHSIFQNSTLLFTSKHQRKNQPAGMSAASPAGCVISVRSKSGAYEGLALSAPDAGCAAGRAAAAESD